MCGFEARQRTIQGNDWITGLDSGQSLFFSRYIWPDHIVVLIYLDDFLGRAFRFFYHSRPQDSLAMYRSGNKPQ